MAEKTPLDRVTDWAAVGELVALEVWGETWE
jgi:hypothetical protein